MRLSYPQPHNVELSNYSYTKQQTVQLLCCTTELCHNNTRAGYQHMNGITCMEIFMLGFLLETCIRCKKNSSTQQRETHMITGGLYLLRTLQGAQLLEHPGVMAGGDRRVSPIARGLLVSLGLLRNKSTHECTQMLSIGGPASFRAHMGGHYY